MNVAQWLYSTALRCPDAPALYSGVKPVANYYEFAQSAATLSKRLVDQYGISSEDRIAIYMANRVEYLVVMYAAWWVGATVVPINSKLHINEAAWILDNAQASLVFTDNGNTFKKQNLPDSCLEETVNIAAQEISAASKQRQITCPVSLLPNSLAWLFYTSGTTGRPKGVMLSHANLMAMTLCYPLDVDTVEGNEAKIYAAPMSHGAGLYNFMFVRVGARHVVPESRGFNSHEIFDIADSLQHATLFAAPTMVKRMVAYAREHNVCSDGIKTIVLGGAPMYASDFQDAISVMGTRFAQIYGQGESPMTITAIPKSVISDSSNPRWQARLASVGYAQSCIEIRITNSDFIEQPTGTDGEIMVRGPSVMMGYWRNEEATKETLVDGWLRTGDIGFVDEEGFLTLTDRSKDVIISGGSNIYPREIEEVLIAHEDVFEVSVIGVEDKDWGETVVAIVVPVEGKKPSHETLDEWCKSQVAAFKRPRKYIFVSELPKNSYGKVLKTELRQQFG